MAKDYFKRYVWLIDLIGRYGHISKREIDDYWRSSSLNDQKEMHIPERTFHNHRQAILDTFGIEITLSPLFGGHSKQRDIQNIRLICIHNCHLFLGNYGWNKILFNCIYMNPIVNLGMAPLGSIQFF